MTGSNRNTERMRLAAQFHEWLRRHVPDLRPDDDLRLKRILWQVPLRELRGFFENDSGEDAVARLFPRKAAQ